MTVRRKATRRRPAASERALRRRANELQARLDNLAIAYNTTRVTAAKAQHSLRQRDKEVEYLTQCVGERDDQLHNAWEVMRDVRGRIALLVHGQGEEPQAVVLGRLLECLDRAITEQENPLMPSPSVIPRQVPATGKEITWGEASNIEPGKIELLSDRPPGPPDPPELPARRVG